MTQGTGCKIVETGSGNVYQSRTNAMDEEIRSGVPRLYIVYIIPGKVFSSTVTGHRDLCQISLLWQGLVSYKSTLLLLCPPGIVIRFVPSKRALKRELSAQVYLDYKCAIA